MTQIKANADAMHANLTAFADAKANATGALTAMVNAFNALPKTLQLAPLRAAMTAYVGAYDAMTATSKALRASEPVVQADIQSMITPATLNGIPDETLTEMDKFPREWMQRAMSIMLLTIMRWPDADIDFMVTAINADMQNILAAYKQARALYELDPAAGNQYTPPVPDPMGTDNIAPMTLASLDAMLQKELARLQAPAA